MSSNPAPKLQLTDDEWRKRLNAEEYEVLRRAGTERAFTGEYTDTKTEGVYQCRGCGSELFRSTEKFESHCGWPSFFDPSHSDAVILRSDDTMGMRRVEVVCAHDGRVLTAYRNKHMRAMRDRPAARLAA